MEKSPELDPLATRPNLDFSKGARGKHLDRIRQGTNVVLIAPDLLDTFPDSASVNEALRSLKKSAGRKGTQAVSSLSRPPSTESLERYARMLR